MKTFKHSAARFKPPVPALPVEELPPAEPHFSESAVEARVNGHLNELRDLLRGVKPKAKGKNNSIKSFRCSHLQGKIMKSKKTSTELPVILSRRDVAQTIKVPQDRVYHAAAHNLLRPDFLDLKGAPFFVATRLDEIAKLLKTPEVAA